MPFSPPTHRTKKQSSAHRSKHRTTEADYIEAHRFYNSARWRKLRKLKLAANPLCERCEKRDRVEPATEVHHIKDRANYPELELDIENTESLCNPCHSADKDHLEERCSSG